MPCKLWIEYAEAAYHLVNRGNRRENIVLDNEDRRVFLHTIE